MDNVIFCQALRLCGRPLLAVSSSHGTWPNASVLGKGSKPESVKTNTNKTRVLNLSSHRALSILIMDRISKTLFLPEEGIKNYSVKNLL